MDGSTKPRVVQPKSFSLDAEDGEVILKVPTGGPLDLLEAFVPFRLDEVIRVIPYVGGPPDEYYRINQIVSNADETFFAAGLPIALLTCYPEDYVTETSYDESIIESFDGFVELLIQVRDMLHNKERTNDGNRDNDSSDDRG